MWWQSNTTIKISIHALLAESDGNCQFDSAPKFHFYPRSPCGERPSAAHELQAPCPISIHALLAESDKEVFPMKYYPIDISIHALLAESDAKYTDAQKNASVFLSTLSLRRATGSPPAVRR